MLCCVVLCCVVLRCVALCCVVLRCVVVVLVHQRDRNIIKARDVLHEKLHIRLPN